jgi:multidrug efflux pump subunit AcrA (membrane-fusion protein)
MRIYRVFRSLAGLAALACLLALSGCEGSGDPAAVSTPQSENNVWSTCFGTACCREGRTLRFPFDVSIESVSAREGQIAAAGDALFMVDDDDLLLQKRALASELDALESEKAACEQELALLDSQRTKVQAGVSEFDPERIMSLIKSIARNKNITSKRDQYRLELIDTLDRFGLIEYYDELLDYAASSDKFYYEKANPLLERIDRDLDAELRRLEAERYRTEAQRKRAVEAATPVWQKLSAINTLLSGAAYESVKLNPDGEIVLANSGYMIDTIYISSDERAASDAPILRLADMRAMEVICYVEEQLIGDIRVGDSAQMSLYADSSVVELGTVTFVARKATTHNGETVVELVIGCEGDHFPPGYNVVAKILPQQSD